MVKLSDVLNAAAALVAKAFPDRYVYIGQEPDQFERPSFFLELVTTNRIRQNIGTDETEIYLTLTIHEKLDTSRNGNQVSALEDMETVLGLFRMGILRAGGRALPVAASSGGQSKGEAYLDLTVTLREGVGYEPDKGLPLITAVSGKEALE